MRDRHKLSKFVAAAVLAAVAFAGPAYAQRMSLAERVTALEQQAQNHNGAQGNIELVNQINALQSQVQTLQGQVEELRHQVDEMRNRSKEQNIDLDSRIGRLEGRNPTGATPPPPVNPNNGNLPDMNLSGAQSAPPSQPPPQQQQAVDDQAIASTMPPDRGAPPPPVASSPDDMKAAYDQAFAALKDGRYAESARRFQVFIQQYPNADLTPNAYYWLGESYYVTQNYPISLDTFNHLLQQFPDSQKAPDALLKIGYCQYEMKQWDQAEATLNQVVQKYPNTTQSSLAQGRLRALKLEGRR
ncbi:MAG TPA: tol-pal system protein YbgF [Rudaea sp.]|jgi:tol-pal system protein YbgF|nr:tol-pal system protein YbgF [Rudaea sp.]